nr:sugar-binding domain-containing protein [uncultured Carboxylicivirga sp.]
MKYLLLLLTVVITTFNVLGKSKPENINRIKYNFNSQWLINVGDVTNGQLINLADNDWKKVTLPYAWNQEEAYKKSIHDLSTGIAWYRKHFQMPKSAKGKKVFIEFEGVRQGGDFYINGHYLGYHENGVMAVGFDITEYLHYGKKENIFAVKTDNDWKYKERETGSHFQWNNDNFNANYGGIPKNVYLHVMSDVYQTLPLYSNLKTTGTYIYASDINIDKQTINLNAEAEVKNASDKDQTVQLKVDLYELDGTLLSSFIGESSNLKKDQTAVLKASNDVDNIHFWSWGYGYLYDVKTSVLINGKSVDELFTRTGFRKTAFKDGMFYLNDRVLMVKGYAQRTSNEWPAIGMSCPPWMSDYTNHMMVESNGNTVRWMHVTPWKQDIESCDRVGLIQAMPAGDAEKDVEGRRWDQRVELMRDAIIYNRNNPSIIFYEGGNESISEEHMAELKKVRDLYDPHGGRAIGSREMLDSKVAEYGGEMLYINKSAHIPMWAMEYSRDEGLRKYWDNYSYPFHKDGDGGTNGENVSGSKIKDATAYNRNQDSHAIENIIRWYEFWEMRPGTGTRVSSGGVNIIFSDTNTHFRGAENYRRSGEVDAMRIPKDNYYAHQVMWDGWVETEKPRTHIVGHWNYTDSVKKAIYVISSGDEVELFINDKSMGKGIQDYRFLYTFKDIQWEEGVIEAVSYDKEGKVLSQDSIETVGVPVKIQLSLIQNPSGTKADGADMAMIQVEVVDEKGRRCPLANDLIRFELSGEGQWLGGIAQGEDNYILSQSLPVECGINRALIRSTTKAGLVQVKANAKGLISNEISFSTKMFEEKDGLSTELSSDGLNVFLDRGPTPKGASFTPSRITVPIISAVAGYNNDNVALSYDDNELSEWRNDGIIETAWVKYKLEKETELDECCIKLTGWRRRQYPIEILVNGELAYSAKTPLSLGYVRLPLKGKKGDEVTIKLIGANTENDAFSQITELDPANNNQELDLYRDPNGAKVKGELRIIEVEFSKYVNN